MYFYIVSNFFLSHFLSCAVREKVHRRSGSDVVDGRITPKQEAEEAQLSKDIEVP